MTEEDSVKSVHLRGFCKDALERELKKYKLTGKHVENLQLTFPDCRCLREVLLTFPNTKELEFSIASYSADLKREVIYPLLRKVTFDRLIPMEMKNFWKLFSNLTDVTIGKRENSHLFTSEFVNKLIQRNVSSLKALKLLDLAFVKSTFGVLRIPCQLKELQIIFFKDSSKQNVCRSEYLKQEAQKNKSSKNIFYTTEEEITSFENLKDILKSQNELECLSLEGAVIDYESLESMSRITSIRNLRLVKPEFKFERISDSAKELFSQIKKFFISHISENSIAGFRQILGSLKEVEILEINCIWPEVPLEPLENRNHLPYLKDLRMHVNHKSEIILNSLQLSENLDHLTSNITSLRTAKEIFKTSPNIREIFIRNGANKVANYFARNFKKLEFLELVTEELSIETVLFIVAGASNIKRANILTQTNLDEDVERKLDEQLEKHFPGFTALFNRFGLFSKDLEVYNDAIDFKIEIGFRSYRMDERFV